jgi:protein phosphatase
MIADSIAETGRFTCFAMSHAGKYRGENQDAVKVCQSGEPCVETCGHLFGIADGMGGYSHGGVASALALDVFFRGVLPPAAPGQMAQKMKRAMQDANVAVYQKARQLGVARMGTTLTAVGMAGAQMHIAHAGDSRAYRIRNGQATCLTSDHTMVGELVRMKVLSPDKVRNHAQRSKLNKSLGIELFVAPDIFSVPLAVDDVIILCTDGVWAAIEDHEFAQIAAKTDSPETLSQALIDLALERDTDDNVSVVVIHAERLAQTSEVPQRNRVVPQFLQRLAGRS